MSLPSLRCYQALTQKPQQPGALCLQGSHSHLTPAILCFSSGCQPPGISSSIHKHHTCGSCCNPSAKDRSQQTDRLTAPRLVRAVPAVVHAVAPLVRINPGSGVAAVENQVPWEAVGQVTCKSTHTGHAKPPPSTQTEAKMGMAGTKGCCQDTSPATSNEHEQMGKLCGGTQEVCPRFLLYLVFSPG